MEPVFISARDINPPRKAVSVNHFHGLDASTEFLDVFESLNEEATFRGRFQSESVTRWSNWTVTKAVCHEVEIPVRRTMLYWQFLRPMTRNEARFVK